MFVRSVRFVKSGQFKEIKSSKNREFDHNFEKFLKNSNLVLNNNET